MSGKQKDLTGELTAVLEEIIEEPVVKETKKGEAKREISNLTQESILKCKEKLEPK